VTAKDEVLPYFEIDDLSEMNKLLIAGANVVRSMLGVKSINKRKKSEPWWKKRISS